MKKQKVLEIVEAFGGGVFTMINDLVNEICDDYEIIIAYNVRKQTPPDFEKLFDKRVKFIKVENFTRSVSLKNDIKAYKELKKIIKEENPDIIHLHSSKAGVLGRLVASGKKYRMLYNPHGFSFLKKDDSQYKRVIYRLIEKIMTWINPECTIVGCSYGEYEEAKKLSNNSVWINNGINVKRLENKISLLDKQQINFNNLKICTVGRIGYQKNPRLFNEIAENLPNNNFVWIGDGELRGELNAKNISILGWKNREEALEELNKYDIFILTSLWEGLPISLLEAMYMRKICIVTNVIGNRDVIEDNKNGFIFNSTDEFNKIINGIKNEKYDIEIILNKAYDDIADKYNTRVMCEKYVKEYEK